MPTLNEAAVLPVRARELAAQEPPWDWIVADGGSSDGTAALATRLGAQVVESPRGRGVQLGAGAAAASGDALLFLHADTALPPGALRAIRSALADPTIVGGNFGLRFDGDTAVDRLFTAYYRARQELSGVFFGDSAMFARSSTFREVRGFPPDPILEDLGLLRRLRQRGRLVRVAAEVRTSARRYRGRPLRTVARWAAIVTLFRLGVSPRRLAWLYPAQVAGERSLEGGAGELQGSSCHRAPRWRAFRKIGA
jgi:rSAM/selenodomain-associated transferase 2